MRLNNILMNTWTWAILGFFGGVFIAAMSGCGSYPIEKYHPHFIDYSRGYARKYNTQRIKPKPQCGVRSYEFIYSKENVPLSQMSGYVCFPNKEVTDALADLDEAETKDCQDKLKAEQNKK